MTLRTGPRPYEEGQGFLLKELRERTIVFRESKRGLGVLVEPKTMIVLGKSSQDFPT